MTAVSSGPGGSRKLWDRRIYRRCSSCGVVRRAFEFRRAAGGWAVLRWVRCPSCGHVESLMVFPRVDPPAGAEEGES
jgi:hypothetical protein